MSDITFYDVVLVHETTKALLVRLSELDDREVWIPKTLVNEDETTIHEKDDVGEITIREWFAQQEGLT